MRLEKLFASSYVVIYPKTTIYLDDSFSSLDSMIKDSNGEIEVTPTTSSTSLKVKLLKKSVIGYGKN